MENTAVVPKRGRDFVASLPSDLSAFCQRLAAWRARCCGPGGRMPNALWRDAVVAARKHGAQRVADTVGLSLAALKRRLEAAPGEPELLRPTFVELGFPSKPTSSELEILWPNGVKLTLRCATPPSELAGVVEALLRCQQ